MSFVWCGMLSLMLQGSEFFVLERVQFNEVYFGFSEDDAMSLLWDAIAYLE